MYCHQCGKEVGDAKYCPYCGTQLNNQPIGDYQPIHQQSSYAREDDAPSLGFAFLSFFIPVVGLVLFIVWNKEYPQKAKSCLKGFIANIVLDFIMVCCVAASIGGYASQNRNDFSEDIYFDTFTNAVVEVINYE